MIDKMIRACPELSSIANNMRNWDEGLFFHASAVSKLGALVATELGLSERDINNIRLGGFFHDYGKIIWPKRLIMKQDLDPDDMKIIRAHPLVGAALIKRHFPFIEKPILKIIEEHHEKPGGKGYPKGLKEVDFQVRLVSAVECFVALTEQRPYRKKSYSISEALGIALEEGFDGEALEVIRGLYQKGEAIVGA